VKTSKEQREAIRASYEAASSNGDWETPASRIPDLLADAERAEEYRAALELIANLNEMLGLQHAKAIAQAALGETP
jgi:hypothetical protein